MSDLNIDPKQISESLKETLGNWSEEVKDDLVGYANNYYQKNANLTAPITRLDTTEAHKYVDQFPNMFIMPKLMYEYGTAKPGFYFYSSEILERLSLFGGMSLNSLMDADLFFIFEFNK